MNLLGAIRTDFCGFRRSARRTQKKLRQGDGGSWIMRSSIRRPSPSAFPTSTARPEQTKKLLGLTDDDEGGRRWD